MTCYILIPCNFNNHDLEISRLTRLLNSVSNSILRSTKLCPTTKFEIWVCGLLNQDTDGYKKLLEEYNFHIAHRLTNPPNRRRHQLLDVLNYKIKSGDVFTFLDADDIVDENYFNIPSNIKPKSIYMKKSYSILASSDGTLKISLPKSLDNYMNDMTSNAHTIEDYVKNILDGNTGGQIWGKLFSWDLLDLVDTKLPYISMWEDIRFWTSLLEEEDIKLYTAGGGTYYWVRNNFESMSYKDPRYDEDFALNLQHIVWNLNEYMPYTRNLGDYNLISSARCMLDGIHGFLNVDNDFDGLCFPESCTDRRIRSISRYNDILTIPRYEIYENLYDSVHSYYIKSSYLNELSEFIQNHNIMK